MSKTQENLNLNEENKALNINKKAEEVKKESKENKKIEVDEIINDFKELSDLTEQEIKKLGRVPVIIRKVYYKRSKKTAYEIEVKLHEYLTIKNQLKQSEYYLLLLHFNLDQNFAEHTLISRCRFVTGINKNDKQYHQIEIYFDKDLYFGNLWLNGSDLQLFNKILPHVKFVERKNKLEIEDTINYYEE